MTVAETARKALHDALVARAGEVDAVMIAAPHRNEPLAKAFETSDEVRGFFCNLVDGRILSQGEEAGTDGDGEEEFEVEVRIELVIRIRDRAERDAYFDAVLGDLAAFVSAENEAPAPLGGACDQIRVGIPDTLNLSLSGLPAVKSGEIPLFLLVSAETFIS